MDRIVYTSSHHTHPCQHVTPLLLCCSLIDKKNARRYDDCLKYTMVSGKKALEQAGLSKEKNSDAFGKLDLTKCGVLVGSGMGGLSVFQDGECQHSIIENTTITLLLTCSHCDDCSEHFPACQQHNLRNQQHVVFSSTCRGRQCG